MDSALATIGLPIAIAIIMFGLGLDLTVADFQRVGRKPRAVVVALACQLVLLPAICFGLVLLFGLPPLLAIGLMLLAASPGGTSANLFSRLFRGDVALNISLTAINTLLSLVTLPLITNFAIEWFEQGGNVSLPLGEVLKVFALVLIPVAAGMVVHRVKPAFSAAMERPVRIGSAVVLATLVVGILIDQRENVLTYLRAVGLAAAAFCAVSLLVGYFVPKGFGVIRAQAIASSMEIGVHNSTLAIFIAVSVLESVRVSVPAAVYSLIMFLFATVWGLVITRGRERETRSPQPS